MREGTKGRGNGSKEKTEMEESHREKEAAAGAAGRCDGRYGEGRGCAGDGGKK